MKEQKRAHVRHNAGFTLMELMIVIVILGMLAAVVVPNMLGIADQGKVTAAKAQIHSFRQALTMYKLEMSKLPTSAEGLDALISNGKKNFLDQEALPLDPWGNPYVYRCPGSDGRDYEIMSYGEDGVEGGSDYAADIKSWLLGEKET
ncbi:MAG: hypothetical protein AMXMBFR84_02180 [Candidatus Hydrogenedentota bacterium]